MANVQKEIGEIVEAIKERGFTVQPTADGHQKVYYHDRPVLFETVPGDASTQRVLTLPSTPSDPRWRDNLIATLIRSRVLDEDPKDAGQRGLTQEDEERREAERAEREQKQAEAEAQRASQASQAKNRAELAADLRRRAERVLGPIGVWKTAQGGGGGQPRRSIGEASRVAFAWASASKVEPIPASAESTYMTFKKLFDASGGLSDASINLVSKFLDEIDSHGGAARYFELLRETLGVEVEPEEGKVAVAPEPEPEPSAVEAVAVEDEDDDRVRDLRERLDAEVAARREAEENLRKTAAELAVMDEVLEDARASTNGGKVPELAFEVLSEIVGFHVTVPSEEGSENLAAVLEQIDRKKEKAVELAKRVAVLEVGAEA